MDRNWVKAPRLSEEYKVGVRQFCEHAAKHSKNISFILCPCQKCLNVLEVNGPAELYEHLMCHGIDKTYTCWTHHGENRGKCSSSNINSNYQFNRVETESGSSNVVKDIPNVVNEELRDHPYNVSEHWILLGINTKTESIYFMDPAPRGTIVKYKHLKRLVETAVMSFRTGCGKTYTKTAFSTFKWTNILCPKQPANDGIFCGHYVGCFIEDVLRSGETSISVNFTRSIRLMCYGRDKMLRFRENWTGFLYNRYLKGKLLKM